MKPLCLTLSSYIEMILSSQPWRHPLHIPHSDF